MKVIGKEIGNDLNQLFGQIESRVKSEMQREIKFEGFEGETLSSVIWEENEIKIRLHTRLEEGMVEEVENLLKAGLDYKRLNYFGLEYKFIGQYLSKKIDYQEMIDLLNSERVPEGHSSSKNCAYARQRAKFE